jgi:hypothetical protein
MHKEDLNFLQLVFRQLKETLSPCVYSSAVLKSDDARTPDFYLCSNVYLELRFNVEIEHAESQNQGYQIGRNFACWAIVHFGRF